MNSINYNPNEKFYDFSLRKEEFNISQIDRFNYFHVNEEQFYYFISKLDPYSKSMSNKLSIQQTKNIIYKKRLNNFNAIQNGIIYKNGKDDQKIFLQDYKNYYYLIFEYDVSKLQIIKDILYNKYKIGNVNLYQFDQNNLIYIFDKNSNFESKINSPLFSNLNNRVNNYNINNLAKQKKFICDLPAIYLLQTTVWHCDYYKGLYLRTFNNIFDQNWHNRFCQNIKIFFNQLLTN